MTTNRLATIVSRQRSTRLRDAVFAACLALAAMISLTSVGTAAAAADSSVQVAHR
jgi:hypothetical protein